jgi:hypothetical protein
MVQKNLLNFDITDPYKAKTVDEFKDQFKRLHGRFPKGGELNAYYEKHPEEWKRKHGTPFEGTKKGK